MGGQAELSSLPISYNNLSLISGCSVVTAASYLSQCMASSQNQAPMSPGGSKAGSAGAALAGQDGHSVTKRLQRELMTLMTSADPGISAFPDGDNLFHWKGTIVGAACTVYAGLKYHLSLEFAPSYPYTAPTVKFVTSCFHPNVDEQGNICLDILKEKWAPSYDVRTVLISLQSLLADPNNDSPLNVQAAEMWKDQAAYSRTLQEHYARATEGQSSSGQ